jgi:hypothetical protein
MSPFSRVCPLCRGDVCKIWFVEHRETQLILLSLKDPASREKNGASDIVLLSDLIEPAESCRCNLKLLLHSSGQNNSGCSMLCQICIAVIPIIKLMNCHVNLRLLYCTVVGSLLILVSGLRFHDVWNGYPFRWCVTRKVPNCDNHLILKFW